MRIKVCHAQCEHCGHPEVADLDLQIHQCGDGQFSMAATCRDQESCGYRQLAFTDREVAGAAHR